MTGLVFIIPLRGITLPVCFIYYIYKMIALTAAFPSGTGVKMVWPVFV